MFQSAPLWFVYILKCVDHTLYTGVTTDLKRRLHEHNQLKSGAKYTRTRRPVTLVYCEIQPNRAEACKREFQLKQLSREQKKRLIDGGKRNMLC